MPRHLRTRLLQLCKDEPGLLCSPPEDQASSHYLRVNAGPGENLAFQVESQTISIYGSIPGGTQRMHLVLIAQDTLNPSRDLRANMSEYGTTFSIGEWQNPREALTAMHALRAMLSGYAEGQLRQAQ